MTNTIYLVRDYQDTDEQDYYYCNDYGTALEEAKKCFEDVLFYKTVDLNGLNKEETLSLEVFKSEYDADAFDTRSEQYDEAIGWLDQNGTDTLLVINFGKIKRNNFNKKYLRMLFEDEKEILNSIIYDNTQDEEANFKVKSQWLEKIKEAKKEKNLANYLKVLEEIDEQVYEAFENPYWYALQTNENDNDWGTGTYIKQEAIQRAREEKYYRIAVIEEGDDPICVQELIRGEDF